MQLIACTENTEIFFRIFNTQFTHGAKHFLWWWITIIEATHCNDSWAKFNNGIFVATYQWDGFCMFFKLSFCTIQPWCVCVQTFFVLAFLQSCCAECNMQQSESLRFRNKVDGYRYVILFLADAFCNNQYILKISDLEFWRINAYMGHFVEFLY